MKIIDFTKVENIFIVCGKTDMRRQIDGLAATIIQEYDMNVYDEIALLKEQNNYLMRKLFGSKKETIMDPNQGSLFDDQLFSQP